MAAENGKKNDGMGGGEEKSRPWHAMEPEKVLEALSASRDGLSQAEVARRLAEYGENVLPAKEPPSLFAIFLHQFKSPLIYILLAAAAVSLALSEFLDAGFIFAVLLINAAIGTFQEWNAERSAAALRKMLRISARVRRDGRDAVVPANELVPGDIVLLESGDRVPADMRLLEANNLAIDESFLTGENVPPTKKTGILTEDIPIGDRLNMAFAGSMVMSGRGIGVTVSTGTSTQVGRIAQSVAFAESAKPPLIARMEKFAHHIALIVGGAVALLFLAALYKGMPPYEVFFLAVALAVSAIPEGLPVAVTVALSIAVRRMARRHVIVRKLPAVESLGSCTCIASDKTGTLTVNRQTVKEVGILGAGRFRVGGEGLDPIGEISPPDGMAAGADGGLVARLAEAGAVCNEGALERGADGNWTSRGDAMDAALLVFARKAGVDPDSLRSGIEKVGEIPYESDRKYAAVFYRRKGDPGGPVRVAVKGALETVLRFCGTVETPAGPRQMDAAAVEREAMAMAEDGYRVLAVASGEMGSSPADPASEKDIPKMSLLGLAGFLDPLRPEAKDAVDKCRRAGIRVVMVTGDHPATAFAIARQLSIASSRDEVVSGAELEKVRTGSPEHVKLVSSARVFARVSPMQKLEIVESLMAAGHFVAVTGDGVNDAPALKRANVGVAMGSGTEVAKDTADLVVTDDNFASIEAGVEEGRFAYDNVRKVTYLLVSCGLAEVLLFAVSLMAGLPIPLLAVQLLWLNLVTNGIQDVALAFEKGEPGAMLRPPRKPTEGIFDSLMIRQCLVSGLTMAALAFGAWYWLIGSGVSEEEARNLLFLLMVLCENVHVFNARSERVSAFRTPISRNYLLFFGVLVAQGIHIAAMYIPPMQKILKIAPVGFLEWVELLALALGMLAAMEIFKLARGTWAGEPKPSRN